MLIYFVRHGQTDDNLNGIIQGHKDTPLNDRGREESEAVGKRLADVHFDEAYSSPLSRASETAEIIVKHHPNLELVKTDGIKERGLGSMEGRRRLKGEKVPSDAESDQDLSRRVHGWLYDFFKAHKTPKPTENPAEGQKPSPFVPRYDTDHPMVLVVSHGGWLGSCSNILQAFFKFAPPPKRHSQRHAFNTSLMVLRCTETRSFWEGEIVCSGDDYHLGEASGAYQTDMRFAREVMKLKAKAEKGSGGNGKEDKKDRRRLKIAWRGSREKRDDVKLDGDGVVESEVADAADEAEAANHQGALIPDDVI